MKKVVSFSGGRTSAYLCKVMIDEFGRDNVDFIYMDTGAEHPKTYEFIKKVDKYLGLDLVCLRGQFNQELGQGHTYKIINVDDLKCDLEVFSSLTKKYGTPTVTGAWCTSRMKEETHDKYCDDAYGKGNYQTWIGIRADEPKRVLGERLGIKWNQRGLDAYQLTITMQHLERSPVINGISDIYAEIQERVCITDSKNLKYMAEITDAEKQDVLEWWANARFKDYRLVKRKVKSKKQLYQKVFYWVCFDLEIDEHLGNCVFCVKKGPNKLALAARDEPELYNQFLGLIDNANPREDLTKKPPKEIMYRKKQSLIKIVSLYENHTRDEIAQTIRGMKSMDTGSCSESCEVFS